MRQMRKLSLGGLQENPLKENQHYRISSVKNVSGAPTGLKGAGDSEGTQGLPRFLRGDVSSWAKGWWLQDELSMFKGLRESVRRKVGKGGP